MQELPVGKRLKECMLAQGYTVETLSEALGISIRSLFAILQSKQFPKSKLFIKIAHTLNLKINYLLGLSDERGF